MVSQNPENQLAIVTRRDSRARSFVHTISVAMLIFLFSLSNTTLWAQEGSNSEAFSNPTDVVIFSDQTASGFVSESWTNVDLASTENRHAGSHSIAVTYEPWGGAYLLTATPVEVSAGDELVFHAYANDAGPLLVGMSNAALSSPGNEDLSNRSVTIETVVGQWTEYRIPLATLGTLEQIAGIWWQEAAGAYRQRIYLDDIRIVRASSTTEDNNSVPPQTGVVDDPGGVDDPGEVNDPSGVNDPGEVDGRWVFDEGFNGDPSAPSQALLPTSMDYVVTHRTHAKEHFTKNFQPYPADHANNCAGPDPAAAALPQHDVYTTQSDNGSSPDSSFYICKNHMMSSMGDVSPYSITSFWPRQEFDFSDGGELSFDVNINEGHRQRHWWEVMIVPREQLKVAAGPEWAAIDENYPQDRIVLQFRELIRQISVGTGATAPAGLIVEERQFAQWDWAYWGALHPGDPALSDRRIRRTMKIRINNDSISWGIETSAGTYDWFDVPVPGGIPFRQGLVVFKTHSYTPQKDGNFDTYTFHWDNIRFDGPLAGRYTSYPASDVISLQRDGDRQIGESQLTTVDLPQGIDNPVLFGQIHNPKRGQVLLSVNGQPNQVVNPYEYDRDDCFSGDWKSFRLPLDKSALNAGENTLTWSIGPRPNCNYGPTDWDGYSVKFLHIQLDQ